MTTTPTSSASNTSSSSAASATSANALTSLSNNFNDFLSLLTTQLQNQDPSSPLDTNQFTSELVQFTGVEQQITTNASLTSLIQATQGEEVIQATGVVGKTVTVNAADIALQNGSGSINFTTTSAEPVSISIFNASGTDIKDVSATSSAGSNTWTWDGTDNSGSTQPDGSYKIVVTGSPTNGAAAASVPFTVNGTATGVTNTNGVVSLNVGALSVNFSDVVSVGN
jgi:flagellar basal-body rod modification protein FlgD